MKANEFVKKYGLGSFKLAVACPQFKGYLYAIIYCDEVDFSNEFVDKHNGYMFKASEIKRLVESHELVESYDGLLRAKQELRVVYDLWESYVGKYSLLKQAVLDVESCL